MPSLLTHHPLKALYALFATALEAFRLPLYIVLYLLPSARPHPKWTYKQAVLIKLLKTFLHHAARIEIRMPLSLKPGREGERFVVMRAPEKEVLEKLYVGPLKDPHGEIVPGELGGTWYPSAYPSSSSKNASSEGKDTEDVVLYVHGGAFVLGTGRIYECGFIVSALLRHAGVHRVFCPQYRLAGRPLNARFPAALQDVLTSYLYLTRELGIPAKRVIVSGDSAGGNVAIGLLRYLAEYGAELDLESPAAALLWSPWVDPAAAVDPARFKQNPNYPTDFVPAVFLAWGIRCFSGRDEATGKPKLDPSNKYITPLGRPFKTPTPLWVQTGGAEVLCAEDCKFAEEMREENDGHVGLWVEEGAVHGIALAGPSAGFAREAEACVRRAREWLGGNRRV